MTLPDVSVMVAHYSALCDALDALRPQCSDLVPALERAIAVLEQGATLDGLPDDERPANADIAEGFRTLLEMVRGTLRICDAGELQRAAIRELLETPADVTRQ